ncbi:uncharacterized protein LOC129322494 [Prosopis cineraria]|uniref:uncharacterized protein LOC129322494 n=1 Tax=Prosopis cineraria TaxID=364024 RepID=UPI00240EAF60|nr:uncharacterized protein LOC129322494 [Prosopis cineraria]
MRLFFEASNLDLWEIVENGPYIPYKTIKGQLIRQERSEFTKKEEKVMLLNSKAKLIIASALSQQEYLRMSNLGNVKEMWDALEIAHEGRLSILKEDVDKKKKSLALKVAKEEFDFEANDNEEFDE